MASGAVRTDLGPITQTDFGFTGQRNISSIGLYDYHARMYDPAIGRFIQPDSIVPGFANPQAFNRYTYVLDNPINMTDPSGNNDCGIIGSGEARCLNDPAYLTSDLHDSYDVTLSRGFNKNEVKTIYSAIETFANAMGGAENFKKNLGGVMIDPGAKDNGDTVTHHIWLNDSIFSNPGLYSENPEWTIIHELAHAWDANFDWNLSVGLERKTGGLTNPYDRYNTHCTDTGLPGCNIAGYFYGGIPPKGSDWGFNRKEDFAESVATYVLGVNQDFIKNYYPNHPEFMNSSNYATPRWIYVHILMTGREIADQ